MQVATGVAFMMWEHDLLSAASVTVVVEHGLVLVSYDELKIFQDPYIETKEDATKMNMFIDDEAIRNLLGEDMKETNVVVTQLVDDERSRPKIVGMSTERTSWFDLPEVFVLVFENNFVDAIDVVNAATK